MRFLSLFAGIGGFDLGLERAGWTCAGQVELDADCRAVLAHHWPAVWRHDDVRTLSAGLVREHCGDIDAIVGGFPCQDISVAGKGAGLDGARSGLWFEYLRLVREVRPRWVVAENVPALRTRGADVVCGGLEAEGYACWPLVVGADDVGAPHRRKRVFIVARYLGDAGCRYGDGWALGAGAEQTGAAEFAGASDGGVAAHARDARLEGLRARAGGAGAELAVPAGGGADGVADADGDGQHRLGRSGLLDGERTACRDDADGRGGAGHLGWPARPGEPQHAWEPPRVVAAEPRVGRNVDGLSRRLDRRARLKQLGNAVVPQVAEVIGRSILEIA